MTEPIAKEKINEPILKEVWFRITLREMVDTIVARRFPDFVSPKVANVFSDGAGRFAVCVTVEEPVPQAEREQDLMKALEVMFRFEEGYELTEYNDTKGKPTIGIGHLIMPSDRAKYQTVDGKLTMTDQEAVEVFHKDVATAIVTAKKWLGAYWDTLSVPRQAVIVGMAFQMGEGALADFGPTRQHIIRGEWNDVKDHFFSTKWFKDTPERVRRMAFVIVSDKFPPDYVKG